MPARAATTSSVTASTSSVVLFAARPDRAASGRIVFNESTATLYLKYGTAASLTSYTVQIAAGGYLEFPHPLYDGAVEGVWAAANGAARCTEVY